MSRAEQAVQAILAGMQQRSGATLLKLEQSHSGALDLVFRLPKDRSRWHQQVFLFMADMAAKPPVGWSLRFCAEYRIKEGLLVQAGIWSLVTEDTSAALTEIASRLNRLEVPQMPKLTRMPLAVPMDGYEPNPRTGKGAYPMGQEQSFNPQSIMVAVAQNKMQGARHE